MMGTRGNQPTNPSPATTKPSFLAIKALGPGAGGLESGEPKSAPARTDGIPTGVLSVASRGHGHGCPPGTRPTAREINESGPLTPNSRPASPLIMNCGVCHTLASALADFGGNAILVSLFLVLPTSPH